MAETRIGPIKKKLLLLLEGGLALGLSASPKQQFRILRGLASEWQKINRQSLRRAIRSLYESKLTSFKECPDGSVNMTLTDEGEQKALSYKLDEMRIVRPKHWDRKWRIIIFDIPESLKTARDTLRDYLRQLGFYQLQRSVFVIPFECKNELEFLIELYGIRKYVRQIIATGVDNELHLKDIFSLD